MFKLIKITLSLAVIFSMISFAQFTASTNIDNNYNNMQLANFYEDYPENFQENQIKALKLEILKKDPLSVVTRQVYLARAGENQTELNIAKEIIKDLKASDKKTLL